jgi:hypothetical protein
MSANKIRSTPFLCGLLTYIVVSILYALIAAPRFAQASVLPQGAAVAGPLLGTLGYLEHGRGSLILIHVLPAIILAVGAFVPTVPWVRKFLAIVFLAYWIGCAWLLDFLMSV